MKVSIRRAGYAVGNYELSERFCIKKKYGRYKKDHTTSKRARRLVEYGKLDGINLKLNDYE